MILGNLAHVKGKFPLNQEGVDFNRTIDCQRGTSTTIISLVVHGIRKITNGTTMIIMIMIAISMHHTLDLVTCREHVL